MSQGIISIFTKDAKVKSEQCDDTFTDINLEKSNVIWKDKDIIKVIPKKYRGLDRFKARKQIIKDLDELGFLEKTRPNSLAHRTTWLRSDFTRR